MLYTYETARRSRSNFKRTLARAALLAGLALIAIGFTGAAWGAQTGLSLGNRLVSHQHRSSSDGGILQGFSPVGTFFINTNNVGNITVSSTMAGTVFRWSPGIANFTAGQFTTLQGAYSINLGSYTANIGAENLMRAHYSGALGYGNSIPNWRYNSYFLGNYMTNTANNSVLIGNGDNLYRSVNSSTNTVKIYNVNIAPVLTVSSYTSIGIGTETPYSGYHLDVAGNLNADKIYVNDVELSTSAQSDPTKIFRTGDTMTGQLTLAGSTLTVTGSSFSVGGSTLVVTSGKVGINTTAPHSTLHVNGDITGTGAFTASSGTFTAGILSGGNLRFNGANSTIYPSSNYLYITPFTDLVNVIQIKGSATYAPRLEINNAANTAQAIKLAGDGNSYLNGGNVGIGEVAPESKLHISSGTITMAGTGTPAKGAALCLTAAGKLGTCTGGTFDACTCTAP